jgi:hypothetical protein
VLCWSYFLQLCHRDKHRSLILLLTATTLFFPQALLFSKLVYVGVIFPIIHCNADLFAEKIGFKLCWGCLVFYPFFYNIGAFHLVHAPRQENDLSGMQATGIAVLFLAGWSVTRLSNLQKFSFRLRPDLKWFLFGLVEQKTVPGTRILISG